MDVLRTQLNPITISSSSQQPLFMNRLSAIYRVSIFAHSSTKFRVLCTATSNSALITSTPQVVIRERVLKSSKRSNGRSVRTSKASSDAQLKANWLDSLTSPLKSEVLVSQSPDSLSNFVIGIDPDASGALAVLKTDNSGISAQVFDSPHVKILVGKRSRRRLDTKSIIELLQSLGAPIGTTAYLEQSRPFPGDGKLGWWSGGFSYGLWIGVLVASGFSVVPVPCLSWKNEFKLTGNGASKDHSREVASTLFPDLCSMLKRKKDHGRAEALLIAAYGKGIKLSCNDISRTSKDSEVPSDSVTT